MGELEHWEAMKAMQEGRKVRRSGMPEGSYYYKSDGTIAYHKPNGIDVVSSEFLAVSNDWEIVPEYVTLADVTLGLKNGARLRWRDWASGVCIRSGGSYSHIALYDPQCGARQWIPTIEQLTEPGWEVL